MKADTFAVDSMYKENLEEWIYDENRLVTYHFLSITLGVHVNLAKQMLYEFYNEEKSKKSKRSLEAMFYLSGIQREEGREAICKYVSTLCPEDKLDEISKRFEKLLSIHIHSLKQKDSYHNLGQVINETLLLTNSEGKSGVDFGPFKLTEPQRNSAKRGEPTQEVIPKKIITPTNIKFKKEETPSLAPLIVSDSDEEDTDESDQEEVIPKKRISTNDKTKAKKRRVNLIVSDSDEEKPISFSKKEKSTELPKPKKSRKQVAGGKQTTITSFFQKK